MTDEARDRIIELCGDLPRLEIFGREKIKGWGVIGDEIDGKDINESIENIRKCYDNY